MELTVRPWQVGRPAVAREYEALLVHFPHLTLADVYRRRELIGKADRALEAALQLDPRSADVRRAMVRLDLERGDRGRAVRTCLELAGILEQDGDPSTAEQELRRAMEIDPHSQDALNALVQFLIGAERKEDAATTLTQAAGLFISS